MKEKDPWLKVIKKINKDGELCSMCVFWEKGKCRRYPNWVDKPENTKKCGEFQINTRYTVPT